MHRGKVIKVPMPDTIVLPPPAVCMNCTKSFLNVQGLGVHKLVCKMEKIPEENFTLNRSMDNSELQPSSSSVQADTDGSESDIEQVKELAGQQSKKKKRNRRGADHRLISKRR